MEKLSKRKAVGIYPDVNKFNGKDESESVNKRNRRKKIDKDFIAYSSNEENNSQINSEDFMKKGEFNNSNLEYGFFKCLEINCGKEFYDNISFKKHSLNHCEKQYICEYPKCGKKFLDNCKLRRHSLVHTGEKPYTCEFCKKSFSLDFNLKTHLRIHTGEKPYICSISGCFKRFSQSSNLMAHEKNHQADEDNFNSNIDPIVTINSIKNNFDPNPNPIITNEIRKCKLNSISDFKIKVVSKDPLRVIIKKKENKLYISDEGKIGNNVNLNPHYDLYGIITSPYPNQNKNLLNK